MDGLSRQESSYSKLLKLPQRHKSQGQGLGGWSFGASSSIGSTSSPTSSGMCSCRAGSLLSKVAERLLKELQAGVPNAAHVRAVPPRGWMCSMWVGASMLGSLRAFRNMGTTRGDHNELGPAVLQRKILLKNFSRTIQVFFFFFFKCQPDQLESS